MARTSKNSTFEAIRTAKYRVQVIFPSGGYVFAYCATLEEARRKQDKAIKGHVDMGWVRFDSVPTRLYNNDTPYDGETVSVIIVRVEDNATVE